jgi:hypothetical protein
MTKPKKPSLRGDKAAAKVKAKAKVARPEVVEVQPVADTDSGWQPYEETSELQIPIDVIKQIERHGFALEWHVRTASGKLQIQRIRYRNGKGQWSPVRCGDFGGVLDSLAAPGAKDGDPIVVGETGNELVLEARPVAIQKQARAFDKRAAEEPVRMIDVKYRSEGVPVPGGDHPAALRKNKVSRTWEQIQVPTPSYQQTEGAPDSE